MHNYYHRYVAYVTCTNTSAVQVRVQYGCKTHKIIEQTDRATGLCALAHILYAALAAHHQREWAPSTIICRRIELFQRVTILSLLL